MAIEIERKFLLDPQTEIALLIKGKRSSKITQGYIQVNEAMVRFRKTDNKYFKSAKTSSRYNTSASEIVENEISKEQFERLIKTCTWKVQKQRYTFPLEGKLKALLDIFEDELQGLVTVKVEFPDIPTSKEFTPPDWFGLEVTKDRNYLNHNMQAFWKKKLEKERKEKLKEEK